VFLGITAVIAMPSDIFPEIDLPVVTIIWQYTGLSTPAHALRGPAYAPPNPPASLAKDSN
jgi:hypothetical protein